MATAEAIGNVVDMSDLKDLQPLSERLNAATDELNEALKTIQGKLNQMRIGVEVWLANHLAERRWFNDDTGDRVAKVWELGYSKLGSGWGLAIREREFKVSYDQYSEEDWSLLEEHPSQPLIRSSREIRIKAVEFIPQLIDALESEAKRSLEAIETAKQIAKSLK